MHILFNGCSYTWGDELESREQERFSTLVSDHYNATHSNISECARSNDAIARTTMEWFDSGNTCDLAIIQLTVISRLEGYNEKLKSYENITLQTPKKWKYFYSNYYDYQLGVDCLFKNFYLLEQFFIKNNIKYMFLLHDKWRDYNPITKTNGVQTWTEYTNRRDMFDDIYSVWKHLIVDNNFHIIRGHEDDLDVILPLSEDYFFGVGHPNKYGHQKISQYIIQHIDNQ